MRLILTAEQSTQVEPLIRHGFTLIGKLDREMFDGTNAPTSGTLTLELGSVPTSALPALREAITKATAPAPVPRRKAGGTKQHQQLRSRNSQPEQIPTLQILVRSVVEVSHRIVNVCLPATPRCSHPLRVVVANVLCDDCAGNNVETWSLQWTRKRDEDVKMVLGDERLALVAEHPDPPRLAGLALNGH
jgi:hypothetical protein